MAADTPGFSIGRMEEKMGLHASATGELLFEDCRIPADQTCSASAGDGLEALPPDARRRPHRDRGHGARAWRRRRSRRHRALRAASASSSGGRSAAFQGVAFMIADMATEIDAARPWSTARPGSRTRARPYSTEAAMAKLFASEVGQRVTNDAVQIHGGYGYIDRVQGRALPARRQADRDRRGDQPDPAPGHQA